MNAISPQLPALRRLLAIALVWIFSSLCAWADTVDYDILLDTDNNPATGCTIVNSRGNFGGLERVLTTRVDHSPPAVSQVISVSLQRCQGGVLSAAEALPGAPWPVGAYWPGPLTNNPTAPVAVVETFLPMAELDPASTTVRAGVLARLPEAGDVLMSINLSILRNTSVPTLSPLVLALLAVGVGLGGSWLARRHHASMTVLGACLLLGYSGMVWAATIVMDGQTGDWSGTQPSLRGDGQNPNLVSLWFTHDTQKAYFRIDSCERTQALRGQLQQVGGAGEPMKYITRSGIWTIQVDQSTVTVTRSVACQYVATVQMWGHPHENLNGKHIKDWLTERRTLLLDDGTKITMHADNPMGVIHQMSIYDGPNSIVINNDTNTVLNQDTDATLAQQRDEAEADGETGYAHFVPNAAPGAIGHLEFKNIYDQPNIGPAPQCLVAPLDASCSETPLGTTGDFYLNPNQVNDLYDDPRLAHT